MQQFDFSQGPYIIPTFMDTLDAYSDKIAGYAAKSQRGGRRAPVQLGHGALLVRLTGFGDSVHLLAAIGPARVTRPASPGPPPQRRPGVLRGPSQFRRTVRP